LKTRVGQDVKASLSPAPGKIHEPALVQISFLPFLLPHALPALPSPLPVLAPKLDGAIKRRREEKGAERGTSKLGGR